MPLHLGIPPEAVGSLFLGVDPGLAHMGLAVVRIGIKGLHLEHVARVNTYARYTLGRRLSQLRERVLWILENYTISGAACEKPSMGSQSAPYSLGAAHGLVHMLLHDAGIPLIGATPKQLTKFASGRTQFSRFSPEQRGGVIKQSTRDGLEERFAFDLSQEKHSDPIDAAALACLACFYFGDVISPNRKQLEVKQAVGIYKNFN